MRLAKAAVIAVLVLLMVVTPLSALIWPGQFEVKFEPTSAGHSPYTVLLDDRTGLVRAMTAGARLAGVLEPIVGYGADGRTLLVSWEGSSCSQLSRLTFERTATAFRITEWTQPPSCVIGSGARHTVAINLWAPVDASTVEFESLD